MKNNLKRIQKHWKRVKMPKGLPPLFRKFAARWCLALALSVLGLYICMTQMNEYEMSLGVFKKKPQTPAEEPYKGPQVFVLQNLNFTEFGPSWKNEVLIPKSEPGKKKRKHKPPPELPVCAPLISPLKRPVKICVHSSKDLTTLQDEAKGNDGHLVHMSNFLEVNPNSQLVDIGCNVGLFSMWAANMNIPVLAVDILPANLALLHLSSALNDADRENYDLKKHSVLSYIQKQNKKKKSKKKKKKVNSDGPKKFFQLITTLHNAVSNQRTKMQVEIAFDDNKGHAHVKYPKVENKKGKLDDKKGEPQKGKEEDEEDEEEDDEESEEEEEEDENEEQKVKKEEDNEEGNEDEDSSEEIKTPPVKMSIDSICLDDLLPFLDKDRKVFLKIDVEGAEDKVLLCAKSFFKKANVRVVFQDMPIVKNSIGRAKKVVKFLTHYGFAPFKVPRDVELNVEHLENWPTHVFWVKPGTQFKERPPTPTPARVTVMVPENIPETPKKIPVTPKKIPLTPNKSQTLEEIFGFKRGPFG